MGWGRVKAVLWEMWSYVEGSGEWGRSREKISVFEHVVLKQAEKKNIKMTVVFHTHGFFVSLGSKLTWFL